MTIRDLKTLAKELGINGYSKMNKAELEEAVRIAEEEAMKKKLAEEAQAHKDAKTTEKGGGKISKEQLHAEAERKIKELSQKDMSIDEEVVIPQEKEKAMTKDDVLFSYMDNPSEILQVNLDGRTFIGETVTKVVRVKNKPTAKFDKLTVSKGTIPLQKYAPITNWVVDDEVKCCYVFCKQSKFRHDVFMYISKGAEKEGLFAISPDFKSKHMRVFMARPEVWARLLQISISEFMGMENHTKILKLYQTPRKAKCITDAPARIMVLPEQKDIFGAATNDGSSYTNRKLQVFKEKIDGKKFQPRSELLQLRADEKVQIKGLLISDEEQFALEAAEAEKYGYGINDFDIIATADSFKLNKPEVGKVYVGNWADFSAIGFKLKEGTSSIGGQAICTPFDPTHALLIEKGLLNNAKKFVELCHRNPQEWLRAYGSTDPDKTMDDNKFLAFSMLINDSGTWRMPAFAAAHMRDAAILEMQRRNSLNKVTLAETNSYVGYSNGTLKRNRACDVAEKKWKDKTGEDRIFFLPSNDLWSKDTIELYGKVTYVVYPTVSTNCIFDAYPLREDIFDHNSPVIYGPTGLDCFSGRTLKNCFRDGDGDKIGKTGTHIKFPALFVQLPEEEKVDKTRAIPTNLKELNEWHHAVSRVIFDAAVTIGIVDLAIRYIYMVRIKRGKPVTLNESYLIGLFRESVIQSLKHLYGKTAARTIDLSDHNTLGDKLVDMFGAGVVPYIDTLEPDLSIEGTIEHLMLTKTAGSKDRSHSGIVQHVLHNLLPKVFEGRTREEVEHYLRGNPFKDQILMIEGCTFKAIHEDADKIRTQFEAVWNKHKANFRTEAKEYGLDFVLNDVIKYATYIRDFYRAESNAIMAKFRRDKLADVKRDNYLRLSRATRRLVRGFIPAHYKMQSNYIIPTVFKNMIRILGEQYMSKDDAKVNKCKMFLKYCIMYLGTIGFRSYVKRNEYGDMMFEIINGKKFPLKGSNSGGVLQYFPARLVVQVRKECDPNNPMMDIAEEEAAAFDVKQLKRDIENDKKEQLGINPYADLFEEEEEEEGEE